MTIPIYLCDSINPPSAKTKTDFFSEGNYYSVPTSVGPFRFPSVLVQKALIQRVVDLLEDSVKNRLTREKFLERCHAELKVESKEKEMEAVLGETYAKLSDLEHKGINGIWARIIKNGFAPLVYQNHFDFVIGNPPWVNWEDLPQSYRDQTRQLWQGYGLFSLKGHEARLGGGKKDISMLMLYVAIDRYLKDKCKLCFVITQTLFKTQGAGDGFRRFQLGQNGAYFRIDQLDDMVDLQPFEGATNRTALVLCTKGEKTRYPVPYLFWKKKAKGRVDLDFSYQEVFDATIRRNFKAQPVGESETSPWMSAKPKALSSIQKVIGQAAYVAMAGSCTWLNGVYWGNVKSNGKGLIIFSNLYDEGKIKIEPVEQEIEDIIVFPLLRGREVQRWNSFPAACIIASQNPITRTGFDLAWMEKNAPRTLAYFERFKKELLQRSGYKKYLEGEPYYSIYNVGEKTFASYKVVWKALASGSEAVVVGSARVGQKEKVIVPEHNTMFVPFDVEEEAHYFCALINSSISSFVITGYIAWFFSAHVLDNIKIPKYNERNRMHKELALLSKRCHEQVASGIGVLDIEEQIDELAADLWGLTDEELKDIEESLKEMS